MGPLLLIPKDTREAQGSRRFPSEDEKGKDKHGHSLGRKEESRATLTDVVCVGTITMADESKPGAMPQYTHDPKPKVQKLCTLSLVRRRKAVIVDTPVT